MPLDQQDPALWNTTQPDEAEALVAGRTDRADRAAEACRRAFGPESNPAVRQCLQARLDPKQPLPDRRGTGSDT